MARRPSKHLRAPRPLLTTSSRAEHKHDGRWVVQNVPARNASKPYVCPGCNQTVQVGTAHVVAWPDTPAIGATSAVEQRRHWHTSCRSRRR